MSGSSAMVVYQLVDHSSIRYGDSGIAGALKYMVRFVRDKSLIVDSAEQRQLCGGVNVCVVMIHFFQKTSVVESFFSFFFQKTSVEKFNVVNL